MADRRPGGPTTQSTGAPDRAFPVAAVRDRSGTRAGSEPGRCGAWPRGSGVARRRLGCCPAPTERTAGPRPARGGRSGAGTAIRLPGRRTRRAAPRTARTSAPVVASGGPGGHGVPDRRLWRNPRVHDGHRGAGPPTVARWSNAARARPSTIRTGPLPRAAVPKAAVPPPGRARGFRIRRRPPPHPRLRAAGSGRRHGPPPRRETHPGGVRASRRAGGSGRLAAGRPGVVRPPRRRA